VSRDDDIRSRSELELAKARLSESFRTCRAIIADYRSKLSRASNPDKPLFPWRDKPSDREPRP